MMLPRILLAICLAAACARPDAEQSALQVAVGTDSAHPWRKPADKIDSILPMAEYLRIFRQNLDQPRHLEGGEASREALARRFLAAVARQDTAALMDLLVTRAEFAWLVFPQHIYAKPPYELDPAIFWLQLRAESDKGLQRALQRYNAQSPAFLGLQCRRDTVQLAPGPITMWSSCVVRYRNGKEIETRRLFGSIVEQHSQVKLLSMANEF